MLSLTVWSTQHHSHGENVVMVTENDEAEIIKTRLVYEDVNECLEELQSAKDAASRLENAGQTPKQVGRVYEITIPEGLAVADIAGTYYVRQSSHNEAGYRVLKHIFGDNCVETYGKQRVSPKEAARTLEADDLLGLLLEKQLTPAQKRKLTVVLKSAKNLTIVSGTRAREQLRESVASQRLQTRHRTNPPYRSRVLAAFWHPPYLSPCPRMYAGRTHGASRSHASSRAWVRLTRSRVRVGIAVRLAIVARTTKW